MTKKLDLKGHRFGRLLVMECAGEYKANLNSAPKMSWHCRCDCGNTVRVVRGSLTSGLTLSCGCLSAERASERLIKHGRSGDVIYRTWAHAKSRCCDMNDKAYKDYGGRGIKMCNAWMDNFQAFAAYMGERPSSKHSIDRFPNNDGNYEPGNVRWANDFEQANNRRPQKKKTHCLRGHIFDDVNTYFVVTPNKLHRSCRICRKMAEDKRTAKGRIR